MKLYHGILAQRLGYYGRIKDKNIAYMRTQHVGYIPEWKEEHLMLT